MGRNMGKKGNRRPKRQHNKVAAKSSEFSLCDDDDTVVQKSQDVKFIDKLMDKAESLMDCFEYETAQKFCQRALDLEPNNLRVLETSSSLMLDVGEVETAIQCLEKAVQLCPNSGYRKYLTLGQISGGMEAVNKYKKGIEIMEDELKMKSNGAIADTSAELRKDLSSSYCSVAEIFMSDCCFEENAETECEFFINKAIETDENNPEGFLCKANFLMVQDKKEEAKEEVKKSLSLWLPKYQDIREGKLTHSEFDAVEICALSYDSRINTSKLLMELQMYEESVEVLEGLVDENDEIVEVWHLLGWVNYLHGSEYKGNAKYYLTKAIEVAKKIKFDDDDLMNHINELLGEIGPIEDDEDEDKDAAGDNDEWEDLSEDENEEMETS